MRTMKVISALVIVFVLAGLFLASCGTPGPVTEEQKPLTIETVSLADGDIGIVYSQTLKASGGSGTYTWSISSGSLPAGLLLKAKNGGISGTPGQAGKSEFTIKVNDGEDDVIKNFSITIKSSFSPLFVNTSSLAPNEVGAPYNRQLAASGGSGKYTWSLSGGALPDGLVLNNTGVITGSATKVGTYGFAVHVDDGSGNGSDQSLNLTIYPAPYISLPACKDAVIGTDYFQIVNVSGGTEQINNMYSSWTIIKGALPDGLSIDNYGDINGKPEKEGTFDFTVKLVDKLGGTATKDLSITVTK
jgi:hypothetical protein